MCLRSKLPFFSSSFIKYTAGVPANVVNVIMSFEKMGSSDLTETDRFLDGHSAALVFPPLLCL